MPGVGFLILSKNTSLEKCLIGEDSALYLQSQNEISLIIFFLTSFPTIYAKK